MYLFLVVGRVGAAAASAGRIIRIIRTTSVKIGTCRQQKN